ncbi:uncharacterized protein [Panulirus ornatus]|uniref:uncharacterized protein isoform X3 n=1 Tax=Panulirus ornatus TaxID=150431 RepID=UPI003A8ADFA5
MLLMFKCKKRSKHWWKDVDAWLSQAPYTNLYILHVLVSTACTSHCRIHTALIGKQKAHSPRGSTGFLWGSRVPWQVLVVDLAPVGPPADDVTICLPTLLTHVVEDIVEFFTILQESIRVMMDIIPSCEVKKNLHRFLISGVQEQDELLSLRRKIEALGGRVEDLNRNIFTPVCTHVIAKEFCTTEKVLGALAGGKWLLHPEYITDSFQRGHWLNETDYELRNHGRVAQYCRQNKKRKGNGIYFGWTIYIKLENVNMTRSFRRVIAAGGAEIASLAEVSKVDLVISDTEMLTSVRPLVRSVTPIVDISYIKDTLILKANPADVHYYLLDASRRNISRKLVFDNAGPPQRIDIDCSLQKRPLTEVPININKKLCAHSENISTPSYQHVKLDHFKKASREIMPVSSTVCQVSAKNLKKKYQRIPFSPEKYSSVTKYLVKEPKPFYQNIKTRDMKRGKGQNEEQIGNMSSGRANNEIEILGEVSQTCEKTKVNEIEILESDSNDCTITGEVGNFENDIRKKCSPQNVFSKNDREYFIKGVKREIENQQWGTPDTKEDIVSESINFNHKSILRERKDSRTIGAYWSNIRREKDPRTMDMSNLGLKEGKDPRTIEVSMSNIGKKRDSRTTEKYLSNLGEEKNLRTTEISHSDFGEGKDCRTKKKYLSKLIKKDSTTTDIYCVNLDEGKDRSTGKYHKHLGERKCPNTVELKFGKGKDLRMVETYSKSSSYAGPKPHKLKDVPYELALLVKDVRVNIGPRIDELFGMMKSKQPQIHGSEVNNKLNPPMKRSNDPSVFKLVIAKEDLKKGIVQFVRKSKTASRIYCCDVTHCLTDISDLKCVNSVDYSEDFDSDQLLYSPNHTHYSPEIRELTVEETSYYESSIDQDTIGMHIMTSKEQEIIVQGLDSLYLNITPYTYPHVELFGDLLRKLILETQFSIVHSRALGLAYRVLTFHPPVNSYMRTYYLRVLKSAIQNEELGCNQAWKFVRSVIETLQINAGLEFNGSSSGSGVEDSTRKREHALRLLQFFIVLFREDIKWTTNWEAVTELLSWRVFWGHSRNPSVLTTPVKQLLNLWVSMQSASPVIRQCLAHLVSILLELAWRCDNQCLIPVGPLPDSLVAIDNEIRLHMKESGPRCSFQLILDLPSPWPRMVICSLIFQELTEIQSLHISLGDIIAYGQAVCASQNTSVDSQSEPLVKDSHQRKCSKMFTQKSPFKTCISPHIVNKKNVMGYYSHAVNTSARGGDKKRTPLHNAVESNHLSTVKLLLECGGDTLLRDETKDGKTAIDFATTKEMHQLLKLYMGTPNLAFHRGECSQKYSKPSIITSSCSNPSGILPSYEDQMMFVFIYTNSYLEVSGARFLQFASRKGVYQVHMCHGTNVKHPKIVQAGELPVKKNHNTPNGRDIEVVDKDDRIFNERTGEIEVTDMDEKMSSDKTEKGKTSTDKSKWLFCHDLSGEVTSPSKVEKSLSDRLYEQVKIDLMTYRDVKNVRPFPDDKTEFLEAIQYLFL